jgi:hypothetical protein
MCLPRNSDSTDPDEAALFVLFGTKNQMAIVLWKFEAREYKVRANVRTFADEHGGKMSWGFEIQRIGEHGANVGYTPRFW